MKEKKKIYIAGCGGMLGEAFHSIFNNDYELKCTDIDVNEPWLSYLDFRDFNAYLKDVVEFKPDYLFHIGAYTDLEYCETHQNDTYVTNAIAVENAVYISNNQNTPTAPDKNFGEVTSIDEDNEQPAFMSGNRTFLFGLINFAVSAIK